MHQEGFISVFSDILYDDHSPSVDDNSRKGIIKYSIFFHVLVG